jgi:hypothetical protein
VGRPLMFRKLMRIFMAASLVFSGYGLLPRARQAVMLLGFRSDPVQMLLYRISDLDQATYEKQIAAALSRDDAELARSLADLADDRHVPLHAEVLTNISEAEQFSLTRSAGQLLGGAVTGEADSPVAFAGALAADLTVIGDVRDLVQQGLRYPDQDNLTVALAAAGVAMSAALAASGGTTVAGKVGLSALKAAKRMGRLSLALERQLVRLTADAIDTRALRQLGSKLGGWHLAAAADEAKRLVKPQVMRELSQTGSALESVFARQGYRGTLQAVEAADSTTEIRRIGRMSERLGGRFRGALLFKRGARLTLSLAETLIRIVLWIASGALWLLWAAYACLRILCRGGRRLLWLLRRLGRLTKYLVMPARLKIPADNRGTSV